MPVYDDLVRVARSLRRELDSENKGFKTFDRMALTNRVREASGHDTTRIKAVMGEDLERALLTQGLRCYPSLSTTTTGDRVRLFRAPSLAADLLDALISPSPDHDHFLAEAVVKIKGKWNWGGDEETVHATPAQHVSNLPSIDQHLEFVRSLKGDPDLATT